MPESRQGYLDDLSDGEQLALNYLAMAWSAFIALDELHPSDRQEFLFAVHMAQNILLARTALREQLEEVVSCDFRNVGGQIDRLGGDLAAANLTVADSCFRENPENRKIEA